MNQRPTYNPLELLRRWVQGETPLEEERQLDQLAEEDPFLAEALEGYRSHPEGRHAERAEQLKARLRERDRKNRGLLFYLPRLAAAAIALAVMVGGFWYINQDGAELSAFAMEEAQAEKSADTALDEKKEEDAMLPAVREEDARPSPPGQKKERGITDKPARSSPSKAGPLLPKPQEKADARSSDVPPPAERQIARAELPAQTEDREPTPAADEIQPYRLDQKEIDVLAKEDTEEPEQGLQAKTSVQPTAPKMAFMPLPAKPENRKITGYVLDENGEPLIGANVLLEGTQLGTITDFDGQFKLEIPDSSNQNLIVSYTGYQNQVLSPEEGDSLTVVLSGGDALLESVTVTGYITARSQRAGTVPAPRPESGFPKLRQYIRDNLKYPDAARENSIEGKVVLRFHIRPDGSLFDFEVEEGLGYGCDEEAIRLLKEGPKWEGAGQEATYSVRFK
ncbi:MAG: TonB family protein [Phaeodactylibacter sp.]|nr:TonB family protein [Phaeodactylibacter sp.]MCB0613901.1 TonB family protein [Phaeodactylibacter sp.]